MAKGQLLIRLLPDDERDLDLAARTAGVDRTNFVRQLIRQATARSQQGLDPFDGDPAPRVEAKDVTQVVAGLNKGLMEIDRIAKDWAKRDAAFQKQVAADTAGVSAARGVIMAEVKAELERFQQALISGVQEFGNALVTSLVDAPRLQVMLAKMERIENLAAAPRTQTNIQWGGEGATLAYWAYKNLILAGIGTILMLMLFKAVPAIGVPVGHGLAGGGKAAFCTIAESITDLRSCRVTDNGATIVMTAQRAQAAR